MTAIIGFKDKDGQVYLACDSMYCYDWSKGYLSNSDDLSSKIIKVKGTDSCYMAITGTIRTTQVLATASGLVDPEIEGLGGIDRNNFVAKIVPNILNAEVNAKCVPYDKGDQLISDSIILFATPNMLAKMERDGAAIFGDLVLSGSGEEFMTGAMAIMKDQSIPVIERLHKAILVASGSSMYVGGDIVVLCVNTGKKTIFKQ